MNDEIGPLNIFCKDNALIERTYFDLFLALYFIDDEKSIESLKTNEDHRSYGPFVRILIRF